MISAIVTFDLNCTGIQNAYFEVSGAFKSYCLSNVTGSRNLVYFSGDELEDH